MNLHPLGRLAPVLLSPDADGRFDDAARELAEAALAYRDDGSTHAVDPRLLELVYRAVRHFRAPYVTVVSGYRPGRPESRHAQGRAMDFVLPGVSDARLAAFLRPQGFVGVGIYPTSGFVHLDVRARSYFWSDASGPSQRNRERPILRAQWSRFDRQARGRGELPTPDAVPGAGDEAEEGAAEAVVEPIESDRTLDEAAPDYDAGMTETTPKKAPRKLTDDDIQASRAKRVGSVGSVGGQGPKPLAPASKELPTDVDGG